jgi:RimJ/RimL family protein N-acetyltransferase
MTIFFESARLWYRPPEPEDTARLTDWINDPSVRKHLASRVFPIGEHAEREWLLRVNADPQQKTLVDRVLLLFGQRGSEEPIGSTGFHGIDWIVRRAEWGIIIGDPTNWNQGFGREVARRMLQYAFEDLNLNRVELRVHMNNAAGIKAYQAAGFVREGTLRQAAWTGGHFDDVHIMSVLREEWRKAEVSR